MGRASVRQAICEVRELSLAAAFQHRVSFESRLTSRGSQGKEPTNRSQARLKMRAESNVLGSGPEII